MHQHRGNKHWCWLVPSVILTASLPNDLGPLKKSHRKSKSGLASIKKNKKRYAQEYSTFVVQSGCGLEFTKAVVVMANGTLTVYWIFFIMDIFHGRFFPLDFLWWTHCNFPTPLDSICLYSVQFMIFIIYYLDCFLE